VGLLDEIDKITLSELGKNARITSLQITRKLRDLGFDITDRAIRHRLRRLESNKVILGYSTILNQEYVLAKINRTVLIKFRISRDSEKLVERLKKYLSEAKFCVYHANLRGDFDWICHFVFDSIDQYELEVSNFLHGFSELFTDFRTYESKPFKIFPYTVIDEHDLNERRWHVFKILNSLNEYDNLNDKLNAIVNSLIKYFDASFARIWLLDKETKRPRLKYNASKSKEHSRELLKEPIMDLDVILNTKKPVITNDILNDSRARHPDWVSKKRLKSFAGYPLIQNDQVIGVLALFSKKKLNAADFELLGVYCEHISKQLSTFIDTWQQLI
jgi:DNA-binding Lrp family transcriptional regulator